MIYTVKNSKKIDPAFLNDILKIDEEVYPKELQGSLNSLTKRYNANKESYLLLYDKQDLIGYVCFFPITEKLSDKIYKNNTMYDDNVQANDICNYSKQTPTDIYVISFAILKNKRNSEAIRYLTNGFMAYIKNKIEKGYLIGNILSTAVSDAGIKLLKDLNFNIVKTIENKYTLMDCKSENLHSIHFHKSYRDDFYIMIPFTGPCNITDEPHEGIADLYINALNDFADYECSNDLAKTLKRTYLGKKPVCLIDDYETQEVLETQNGYLFLTSHINTNLHILTLVIHNNKLSTTMLQDQVVSKNLFIYDNERMVELSAYVEEKYKIKKCGEPKTIVCLSNKPENPNEIRFMLATEAYDGEYNLQYTNYYLDSEELIALEKQNLSQHVYSKAYASEVAVVYINEFFSEDFKKNLTYEDGTLFTVELAIFRNSAIYRINNRIVNTLSHSGNVSLKTLERLYKELAKTTPFWNKDNFYYHTAQNLANNIDRSFKTDENFEMYKKNQDFLESIVNLKNAQSTNRENKILNTIATTLALLQVIPILISFLEWVVGSQKMMYFINSISAVSTIALALIIIVLIKRYKNN